MPFQKGHKLAKGGKREGAGRKSLRQLEQKKTAAEIARAILEENAKPVMDVYVRMAMEDPTVTKHFVDKVLPTEYVQTNPQHIINFIRFDNPVQLQAKDVSDTLLAVDVQSEVESNGSQESSEVLASKKWERQDRLEFHNFYDVPGKRG